VNAAPDMAPQEIPEEAGEPPRFITPVTSIDADEGNKVVFEAVVAGSPQPEIIWYRENEEITSSLDFHVSLQFINLWRASQHKSMARASQHKFIACSSQYICL